MKMKEEKTEVPLDLKMMFRLIYGFQSKVLSYGFADTNDYKNDFSTLLNTIKHALIDSKIQTDLDHYNKLITHIDRGMNYILERENKESVLAAYIKFLTNFIFLLIGEIPSNYDEKKDNRGNWALNNFRQIAFSQDKDQRKRLLFARGESGEVENIARNERIHHLYDPEKLKGEGLLEWFARTRPSEYIKFFGRVN